MSEESFVYLRNTVSGVTGVFTVDDAAHILSNEWFKRYHVVVDSPKDSVLGQTSIVDDDGNRNLIKDSGGVPVSNSEEKSDK